MSTNIVFVSSTPSLFCLLRTWQNPIFSMDENRDGWTDRNQIFYKKLSSGHGGVRKNLTFEKKFSYHQIFPNKVVSKIIDREQGHESSLVLKAEDIH